MSEEKQFNAILLSPLGEKPTCLTREDVWGKDGLSLEEKFKDPSNMLVARGSADENVKCPHFGDVLAYKSVTVVCHQNQIQDVIYILESVHGAGCVEKMLNIGEGKFAIRSNYMAW